jgi:KTSC domain
MDELRKWSRSTVVKWVPVKWRMLAAVAYNRDWQQLYLEFRSGDVYCYRGVPVERYQELLAADSKGKYVRSHLLNRYPYQRIHSAVLTAS